MALTALPTVGIAGIGLYIPEPIVTGAEIAARTGLPEFVVRDKMGIQQVHVAGQDDTITAMSVRAAERALADADRHRRDGVVLPGDRSEEHTSELQSRANHVFRHN